MRFSFNRKSKFRGPCFKPLPWPFLRLYFYFHTAIMRRTSGWSLESFIKVMIPPGKFSFSLVLLSGTMFGTYSAQACVGKADEPVKFWREVFPQFLSWLHLNCLYRSVKVLLCAASRKVAGSIPRSNFSLTWSFWPHCGLGVDSASNKNEYQVSPFGGREAASA